MSVNPPRVFRQALSERSSELRTNRPIEAFHMKAMWFPSNHWISGSFQWLQSASACGGGDMRSPVPAKMNRL